MTVLLVSVSPARGFTAHDTMINIILTTHNTVINIINLNGMLNS